MRKLSGREQALFYVAVLLMLWYGGFHGLFMESYQERLEWEEQLRELEIKGRLRSQMLGQEDQIRKAHQEGMRREEQNGKEDLQRLTMPELEGLLLGYLEEVGIVPTEMHLEEPEMRAEMEGKEAGGWMIGMAEISCEGSREAFGRLLERIRQTRMLRLVSFEMKEGGSGAAGEEPVQIACIIECFMEPEGESQ